MNTSDKIHSSDKRRVNLEKLPKRHYLNYDEEVILRDIQRYKHVIKKTRKSKKKMHKEEEEEKEMIRQAYNK